MRTDFLPNLQREPISLALTALMGSAGGAGGAAGIGQALGALQAGGGIVGKLMAKAKMKKLMGQRKAFQTPDEVYDILHATQAMSQQGFDPSTLDYLTNEIDTTFSSGMGAMLKMGGDVNSVAALFGQNVQAKMGIGAQNHALQMQNFSKYLSSLELVAKNKEAEWASRENITKDKMQAVAQDALNATKDIQSGANAFIASQSAYEQGNLYREDIDGRERYGNGNYRPRPTVSTTVAPPPPSINPLGTQAMVNRTLTIPPYLLNPMR